MHMKSLIEELSKMSTVDLRRTLRWLNNQVEHTVKATDLASMKHDKVLHVIEKHYRPSDVERALTECMLDSDANGKHAKNGAKAKHQKPATKKVHKPVTVKGSSDGLDDLLGPGQQNPPAPPIITEKSPQTSALETVAKGLLALDDYSKRLETVTANLRVMLPKVMAASGLYLVELRNVDTPDLRILVNGQAFAIIMVDDKGAAIIDTGFKTREEAVKAYPDAK
jgi:hypothetical protein